MRLKKFLKEQVVDIGGGAVGVIPNDAYVLDFPELRQVGSYDCGALALQSVLVYYGMDINEETVTKQLGTTRAHGTPIKNMIAGAEYYGLDIEARTNMTIKDLITNIDKGCSLHVSGFLI